jgi:hypothetical protein
MQIYKDLKAIAIIKHKLQELIQWGLVIEYTI